jgi:hypothetical protein
MPQGSYGPDTRPNRLKSMWAPGTALRTHLTATRRKHSAGGPTQGSDDPIGRSNRLWLGSSWPSTCGLLVGSLPHSGGARDISRSCLALINRRGGVKKRTTHLKATSHLCLLLPSPPLLVEVKLHLTMVCVCVCGGSSLGGSR